MLTVTIPGLRLVSEANAHEHWRKRHQRAKMQKHAASAHLWIAAAGNRPTGDLVVTITRVAPRMLDSDNATGSAKHVRDGIALWLRRDDSMTSGIEWVVKQAKGKPGEYRVDVRIETADEARGSRREEVA